MIEARQSAARARLRVRCDFEKQKWCTARAEGDPAIIAGCDFQSDDVPVERERAFFVRDPQGRGTDGSIGRKRCNHAISPLRFTPFGEDRRAYPQAKEERRVYACFTISPACCKFLPHAIRSATTNRPRPSAPGFSCRHLLWRGFDAECRGRRRPVGR